MFAELNEQMKIQKEKMVLKERLEAQLTELEKELTLKERQKQNYLEQLEREKKDVDRLEKLSLTSIFHTVIGNKELTMKKEMEEYLMAKLQYEDFTQGVAFMTREVESKRARIAELSGCEGEYKRLFDEKETYLEQMGSPEISIQLQGLNRELDEVTLTHVETAEAFVAAEKTFDAIEDALVSIQKAKDWGTYDLFGGGMISSVMKHERLDEAYNRLNRVSNLFFRLKKELEDIDVDTALYHMEVPSFSRNVDFFFDNIFSDLEFRRIVNNAEADVVKLEVQVERLLNILKTRKTNEEMRIQMLSYEIRNCVESA